MRRICEATPRDLCEVNSDVPRWLADLILRLPPRPEQRFQTAAEVARIARTMPGTLQHPTAVPRPIVPGNVHNVRPPHRSTRRWALVVSMAAIGLACACDRWHDALETAMKIALFHQDSHQSLPVMPRPANAR